MKTLLCKYISVWSSGCINWTLWWWKVFKASTYRKHQTFVRDIYRDSGKYSYTGSRISNQCRQQTHIHYECLRISGILYHYCEGSNFRRVLMYLKKHLIIWLVEVWLDVFSDTMKSNTSISVSRPYAMCTSVKLASVEQLTPIARNRQHTCHPWEFAYSCIYRFPPILFYINK